MAESRISPAARPVVAECPSGRKALVPESPESSPPARPPSSPPMWHLLI